MGVNTEIKLPHDVRIDDVADVIGILAGNAARWETIRGCGETFKALRVDGVKVRGNRNIPEMAEIIVKPPKGKRFIDGHKVHSVNFFFEVSDGGRHLNPPSTPFWIAVGIRLARFFGGRVVFNDCKSSAANRRFSKPRSRNNAEDNKGWHAFQKEMANVRPLTKDDLKRTSKYSAWSLKQSRGDKS
jgi:hypothetical protein